MSIILPWQKCPCGSGKSFYKCCSSLKHSYCTLKAPPSAITKSPKIIIDKTIYADYVRKIQGFLDYHITQDINTNFKDYCNLLCYLDGAVNQLYKYTDCKKGCSHCCHMTVTITQFESLYIKQYIKNHWSKSEINDLIKSVKKIKRECPDLFDMDIMATEKRSQIRMPCVFLKDNCCSIYSVRPAICRTYISLSPSEICYKALFEPESQAQPVEINMYNDIMSTLFDYHFKISQVQGICPLPYWFQSI